MTSASSSTEGVMGLQTVLITVTNRTVPPAATIQQGIFSNQVLQLFNTSFCIKCRCNVRGIQTCLPREEVCFFSPESCEEFDPQCELKSWNQKLQDCFGKLWSQLPDYSSRLCATNGRRIADLEDEPDEKLFENFWFFEHLSYNISICQDQVSARLISCRRNCQEHDSENLQWLTCSTGRCVSVPFSICDGYTECTVDKEDESFEKCHDVKNFYDDDYEGSGNSSEEYYEDEFTICHIDYSNNIHFPCYKSGKCIPPSLVSFFKYFY